VSFNRRKLAGVVVSGREDLPEGVKRAVDVAGLLESEPVFTPELLRFLEQAAKYYMHPIGEVLRAAAPALPAGAMKRLRADGFLDAEENLPGQRVAHHVTWEIQATDDDVESVRLGARQKKLLELLRGRDSMFLDELRSEISDPRSVVRALAEKGLLTFKEVEANPDPFFRTPVERDVPPPPTAAQQHAIDAITDAMVISVPLAMVLCFTVAALAMRSVRLALVSIVPIALVIVWLLGFMGLSGLANVYLIWFRRPFELRNLWLSVLWQGCNLGGFWIAYLLNPLYEGEITVPGIHTHIFGFDENVFVFSVLSLVLAGVVLSLRLGVDAEGHRAAH